MSVPYPYPGSIGNSTETPLGAGETFTGSAEEASTQGQAWQSVSVSVYSDVDSADQGLSMEFSQDGVNWYARHSFTVGGGVELTRSANVEHRYFRVVYTTSKAQSVFRLQTRYRGEPAVVSAAQPMAVRISDGEGFTAPESETMLSTQARIMAALEALLLEQRLTNTYLSEIVGETFTEKDIENGIH